MRYQKWLRALSVLSATVFVAVCQGAALAVDYSISGDTTYCLDEAQGCIYGGASIDASVDWKVGTLMGQPVINASLSWSPGNMGNHLPPAYAAADPTLASTMFNGEAAGQFRLYDAKAKLTLRYGNNDYTMITDLGVPGKPGGERSYNVAGSPDWSRTLMGADGNYIDAAMAKEIMGAGTLNVVKTELASAEVDTSRFEKWWLEKNIERYTAPLKAAIDTRLQALADTFGLPVDALRAEIKGVGKGMTASATIAKLEDILLKLSPDKIPAKFLGVGPEKLARVQRYAARIAGTDEALRAATKSLPPMPGSSDAYDTWYDQVAVRMNRDAARLAHLQNLKAEAERAEREAELAAQRAEEKRRLAAERKRRLAARKRQQEEEQRQRDWEAMGDDYDTMASIGRNSLSGSGWGYPLGWSNSNSCGYGGYEIGNGQCGYFQVDPALPSSQSATSDEVCKDEHAQVLADSNSGADPDAHRAEWSSNVKAAVECMQGKGFWK